MIDIKEIRIGNWILSPKGEPFQVYAEIFNDIEMGINFMPILLTQEHLEKIGMIKRFPSPDCNIWDIKEELRPLPTRNKTFTLALIDRGWIYPTAPGAVPFQYLHQLQNLYYALTGQELELH
jgi:hypothetical protein